MTTCNIQLLHHRAKPGARVSIILLDWGVRESFHSIRYLNNQTVPRSDYELLWIEFYEHRPPDLSRLMETTGMAALDTWLVMAYPKATHYHKHRMYNAGIVLANGEICVFCDSDAIFLPTFVESIIKAFEERPNAAIHLDEVRNYGKRFYPFSDPELADVLGEDCVNWTGSTTTGLDNHPDMLHMANYGACMAAWRRDLIRIGGADEHIDYLGYICGPYEMTFRLANLGREEHWLRDEHIYHVWHPNTSGCNVEYKGPDDGRGMSLPALAARRSGRIEPLKENPALRALRDGAQPDADTALALLVVEDDGAWHVDNAAQSTAAPIPQPGYFDFNITWYRGTWYALDRREGEFDPIQVRNQGYRRCYAAASREALIEQIREGRTWLGLLVSTALRRLQRPVRKCGKWLRGRKR
jgi:Glycosyl transferase family 2